MRFLAVALSALIVLPPAFSQQEEPTFKTQVSLVNILFSVRDKRGGLIGNLNKDDFTIFENGKQQDIKYFTRDTNLPLTIGLLVDVSVSQGRLIQEEQSAAQGFFSAVLKDKDLAFLISFGPEADLLQDYTNSRKLLAKALDDLRVSGDAGGGVFNPGPVPTMSNPKGTILYDAVYLASDQELKGQVGRKAVVLITDGEDQGSHYNIAQAIESAQRADAIVYSIYYVDRGFYASSGGFYHVSDGALRRMSEETGGRVFHVDHKHPLTDAFKEIQDEMRSQYAIAYAPTDQKKDGSFRRIEIRVNNKDYKVQARKGYYATETKE